MAALPAPERAPELGDPPPLTGMGRGIADPSLARLIARFAAEARARG